MCEVCYKTQTSGGAVGLVQWGVMWCNGVLCYETARVFCQYFIKWKTQSNTLSSRTDDHNTQVINCCEEI